MNNMQKHKNNSGFTLVELIVVMCIMGIIMGAVLNFLRPTAQLYNTTNKYLNQEEAVDMIADYLKDDLMYATGVFIIESNQADINAVAQRTNAALTGTPDGKGLDYKNCIVLDNASIRSSGTAAAIRKEATGTITKYALKNEHFVDVASDDSLLQGKELYRNTFALQDQSFMGEDQYRFSVIDSGGDPALGTMAHLTIHIEVSSLVRDPDTDTYKVHETEFEADKPIEFLNSTSSIVTSGFNVWTDAGEYSGDDYIYIFYNRKDKITQDNVRFKCQFYLMGADGKFDLDNFVYETTVVDPADLREEVQKMVEMKNLEMIEDENYVYRRTKFYATKSDIYDITDPSVVDLSNVTSGAPGSVLKLYAVYTRALKTDERYTVNFYHDKDKNSPIKSETDIPFGGDITDRMPEWEKDAETSPGVYEVQYWASCVTEARQNSFNHITSDLDVYEASYKEYKVSFVKQDGTPAEWTDSAGNVVDYIRVREGEGIAASQMPDMEPYKTEPSGVYTWVFKDGDYSGEQVDETKTITKPTTIEIHYEPASTPPDTPDLPDTPDTPDTPNPPPGGVLEADSSNVILEVQPHNYNNWDDTHPQYTIELKMSTKAEKLKGKFTVVLEFSEQIQDPYSIICYSYPGQIKNYNENFNGNTMEIEIELYNPETDDSWRAFNQYTTIQLTYNNIKFMNLINVNAYIK